MRRPTFTQNFMKIWFIFRDLVTAWKNNWRKNGQKPIFGFFGDFLNNQSSDLHEILCAVVSTDDIKTSFLDQIDLVRSTSLGFAKKLKKMSNNFLCQFSPPVGVVTPKLGALLDLAHWWFHLPLKILNTIIFGCLAAVLDNAHRLTSDRLQDVVLSQNFVPDV